ncbi:hypothetical protein [Sphingobacterium lactis]|uniref:hypothetical protein n=2 Tax=Sphingobacterium TaxID=28453 RepID=UPI003DA3B0B1
MKIYLYPLFVISLLLAMVSCKNQEPEFPKPQPEPEPVTEYTCPKEGDIYRLWPDTIFINATGQMFSPAPDGKKIHDVPYDHSQFMLGTCQGKLLLRNKTINSPGAVKMRTEEGKAGDIIPIASGNIYLREIVSKEDIARVLALKDGGKADFEIALLNFRQDIIQTNTITFIHRADFKKP